MTIEMNTIQSIQKASMLALAILFSTGVSIAQTGEAPIEISPTQKNVYLRNGQYLEPHNLKVIMASNPEAMAYMRKAGANTGFATVLSIAGGILAGIPLGAAIRGGDPNWALAGVGVGLFLLTIPLEVAHNKNVHAAVETYNRGLDTSSTRVYFQIGLAPTGVGLTVNF